MTAALSVSRLVNVSVDLTPQAARFPVLSTCLVLGTSTVIDTTTRMRSYDGIDAIAADFGTAAPEYLAALLWFEQRPQPSSILIGRWAKTASHGQLIGGALTAANTAISAWTAIANGGFSISIDGVVKQVTAADFSDVTNLNGVASVINAILVGATLAYNAVYNRFEVTDATTGITSVVGFAAPSTAGGDTDIHTMLSLTQATGAYQANGVAAESAVQAVTLFDTMFSSQWYGLVVTGITDDVDHVAVAAYIEADAIDHFYGVTTQDPNALDPQSTTDLPFLLTQQHFQKSWCQYSSTNAYAAISALARILTTNWAGNNTTIALMYKQEPGVIAEFLTSTQANALMAKNCNVFVNYNNDTAIIQTGVTPSGIFADSVIGIDWLSGAVQTNVFNLLFGTTKIPQTDAGMNQIHNAIASACEQGVANGLIAPGVWNAGGFGQIVQGSFLSKGYYIFQPPVSTQPQPDRAGRKSVPFQVAVKLGGAVNTVDVAISVNQ